MELNEFLTPALVVGLFAWLKIDIGALGKRIDALGAETSRRFDQVHRDIADLRENVARLQGTLDGFVAGRDAAGRHDRDAA